MPRTQRIAMIMFVASVAPAASKSMSWTVSSAWTLLEWPLK